MANFPYQRVSGHGTVIDSRKHMDRRTSVSRTACLVGSLSMAMLLPCAAIGHHTFAYVYNTSQVAEIVGEVIDVQWGKMGSRTEAGVETTLDGTAPSGYAEGCRGYYHRRRA